MRGDYYRRNRAAAYWRAKVLKMMRACGCTYAHIGEHFNLSAERVRQICAAPVPPAQLSISFNEGERQ